MSKLIFRKLISQISRFRRDEDGVVLVLVAAALVAILGFMALVTDVGALALEKRRLQNACDAAALAAAQELPDCENAETIGCQYLCLHDVNEAPDITFDNNDREVTVWVEDRKVNFIFAKIFGLDQGSVKADATAVFAPMKSIKGKTGMLGGCDPIGISEARFRTEGEEEFEFGREYTLIGSHKDQMIGSGNFGFLALGKSGDVQIRENLKSGYKGKVESVVDTKPGNISEPTKTIFKGRLCKHEPECTASNYEKDCPSLLTVVILKEGTICGSEKVEVVGFATFLLSEVGDDDKTVKGFFVRRIAPDSSEYIIDPGGEDFGLMALKLIK